MTQGDPPSLATVPGVRMSEREAEQAALDLVRAMEKATSLRVLASLRCWRYWTICGVIGWRSFNTAFLS